jgi:integrase
VAISRLNKGLDKGLEMTKKPQKTAEGQPPKKQKKKLPLTQKNIDRQLLVPGVYPDKKGRVPGLRFVVTENSANWIFRFWKDGRARDHGLGSARIKLRTARIAAKAARDGLDNEKIDPIEAKRAERAANRVVSPKASRAMSFRAAAESYFNGAASQWSANQRHQFMSEMKIHVWPLIGSIPVADITIADVLVVLEQTVAADRNRPAGRFWDVRQVTAARVRSKLEKVLGWSTVRKHRTGDNPALWRGHLEHALPRRSQTKQGPDGEVESTVRHHPALPYLQVPTFLADMHGHEGVAARALQFLTLCASRTAEVLGARWSEFDIEAATWTIPAERMKARRPHRVPLSAAALEILSQLPREIGNPFVFIGARNAHLSSMALSAKYRRSGFAGTVHGLRSSFRDWAAERSAYPYDVIEQALAHATGSATERAYLRSDLFEQRRQLMDLWARFCESTTPVTADVVPIRAA